MCRLVEQKGIDLLLANSEFFLREDCRLIVLGSGEARLEEGLRALQAQAPGKIVLRTRIDEALSHLIEAGTDFFMMPSLFEPCGLNQIYSMKYGTIPVVRATGGLADTVTPVGDSKAPGTGFVFTDYTPEAFLKAIHTGLNAYANKDLWRRIMVHAMTQDFSWKVSARKYLELYKSLV